LFDLRLIPRSLTHTREDAVATESWMRPPSELVEVKRLVESQAEVVPVFLLAPVLAYLRALERALDDYARS
jgi:hypothetical protein